VDATTNLQYQPGVGSNVRTGDVQLFNALAVANANETATLSVTILNRTGKAIKLNSVSGRLSDGRKLTATTTPAIIDDGETVATGPAGSVILKGEGLEAGKYVKLSLKFSGGERVTVEAPVVARSSMYDDVDAGPGGQTAEPEQPEGDAAGETVPEGEPGGSAVH
jgi:copper(I)-binding protein